MIYVGIDDTDVLGSPGTTAYWDSRSAALLPDLPFRWAAFVAAGDWR